MRTGMARRAFKPGIGAIMALFVLAALAGCALQGPASGDFTLSSYENGKIGSESGESVVKLGLDSWLMDETEEGDFQGELITVSLPCTVHSEQQISSVTYRPQHPAVTLRFLHEQAPPGSPEIQSARELTLPEDRIGKATVIGFELHSKAEIPPTADAFIEATKGNLLEVEVAFENGVHVTKRYTLSTDAALDDRCIMHEARIGS